MNLRLREPSIPTTTDLGTATIENRALTQRQVMQVVTLPLRELDNIRDTDPVSVLDSGTGQAERCQVESWAMRYPSGAERVIRLHYPAVLPANNLRIAHTFARSTQGVNQSFAWYPSVARAMADMSIVFFCGPKATHWVPVYTPTTTPSEIVLDGNRVKILRYFARVYRPLHAPTLETQFWAELELHVYSDRNYMMSWLRWGVDDPRIGGSGSDLEDRNGLSLTDSEVGFDFYVPVGHGYNAARPQPMQPQSNTHSLTWNDALGQWRWVWDRATRNNAGVLLNHVYPWGTCAQARVAITCSAGETDQLRIDSAEAWHSLPAYHFGISDSWMARSEAYAPWGEIPRRQKTHEHSGTPRDPGFIKGRLEIEGWSAASADGSRGCQGHYSFNHKATSDIERLWHQNDGQTGGTHEWWQKNPYVAACHYSVPAMAHYVERGIYTCPFSYFFRQANGRILNLLDLPQMRMDRGEPHTLDLAQHGKSVVPRWRTAGSISPYKMLDPVSGGYLLGADTSHFEASVPWGHAAIFGDDGARRIAEQWTYGPLHLGGWNLHPSERGNVGDQRGWARGATMWAWSLWLFGNDRRLVDRCADAYVNHATLPQMQQTDAQYPGRVNHAIFFFPAGYDAGVASRVSLARHPYQRTWEMSHAAGLRALPQLAGHLRPELRQLEQIARWNADSVWRHGMPRRVDENSGDIESTFWINGSQYAPMIAAAIVAGATRPLSTAEISDNNWSRCAGSYECGQPPTLDGYAKINGPGAGSFVAASAWDALDGPLALGDPVLLRYVDPRSRSFRFSRPSAQTHPYLYWIEKDLYKWGIGRMDDVVEGAPTTRGTHGDASLRRIAASRAFAGEVWCLRDATSTLQRRSIASGAVTATIVAAGLTPSAPWTGATCFYLQGQTVVALLDGADPLENRSSYQIAAYLESLVATSMLATWSFRFADGLSRKVHGITWAQQSQVFVVGANRAGERPSLWTIGIADQTARRISLPMTPTRDAQIVLDVPDVADVQASVDGVMLAVSSAAGDRDYYVWNRHSNLWGVPRLRGSVALSATFSTDLRDSDSLRVALLGATQFQEAAI